MVTVDMKINDIALTEIAHEAAKKEKKILAKKLLEKETSITRKIPVLVWMKEYESSLEEAFNGKDTNLINLVLIKFFGLAKKEERDSLYAKVLSLSPELVVQLINFLKKTGRKDCLQEFFEISKGSEFTTTEMINMASQSLTKAPDASVISTSDLLKSRATELNKVKTLADNLKDKETSALIENEIKVVDYMMRDPSASTSSIDKFNVAF